MPGAGFKRHSLLADHAEVDLLHLRRQRRLEPQHLAACPHAGLEGGERSGKMYKPIIRVEPSAKRTVSWAEFVEAALLREYRRTHNVPMAEVRAFVDLLRERYGVPYPLVDRRPFVADRQLVFEAQDASGLDPDFCLVATVRGQLILTPPSAEFFSRVAWERDAAMGWRPHDDPHSPVQMAPDVRSGRPAIKGISTEVIASMKRPARTSRKSRRRSA